MSSNSGRGLNRDAWWVLIAVVALAAFFLGSRGLWDPDEGRYTNVAINMLLRGDWLDPHRSLSVGHWTKPPLTYWAIASSLLLFGMNTWAARVPVALAYLLTTWLVSRIARRLAPGREALAALVFATMLLPAIASQLVTTDFILVAFETLAMWSYVELRWGSGRARWAYVMWAAFGLAFLTKGPPGLLPLLAVAASEWAMGGGRSAFRAPALLLFAAVALWWFVVVSLRHPLLLPHFLGREVVDRVASNTFARHGEWYGWLVVYLPTLLLGTLPWTWPMLRGLRQLPTAWRAARARAPGDGITLFLLAWVVLPLAVFCLSRSRLPLYFLPLCVPLALLATRALSSAAVPWRRIGVWIALLLVLRAIGPHLHSIQNAREWADAVQQRAGRGVDVIVFVDDEPRYGLHLHTGAEVETVSLMPLPARQAGMMDGPVDGVAATELMEPSEEHTVWITPAARWPDAQRFVRAHGFEVEALGAPYRNRVIFRVWPAQCATDACSASSAVGGLR